MAITFEWCVGGFFNSDSLLYEIGTGNYSGWQNAGAIAKSGLQCIQSSTASNAYYVKKATTASRQKRSGYAFSFNGLGYPASGTYRMLSFRDASNNDLVEVRITNTGTLALYVAGVEQDTYSTPMPPGAWRHLGLDVKIDNAAGWAYVYIDGSEVMSFSGNTGNVNVDHAYIGSGPTGVIIYIDDWYCDDTAGEGAAAPVPMRYFDEMTISAAGNYAQFTPSSGSNYACMDENPPNEDTDYVSATAADLIDSYATTDMIAKIGLTINAVHAGTIAKKLGVAATQVKPFLRENATDWAGTAQNCSSSYTWHTERRTLCPDGTAWDQTGINGLEVGLKSAGAYA